jgi:3-isopropylmalate/(R)-2-methylmalate dehydratase small subunit
MPKPFNKLSAIAAPIMRSNIDTDVIIRIERLVGNSSRGTLGKWAFGALRYLPDGSENPEFILNREPYRQAEVLVTGPNFGCGSSREGAVWALMAAGLRCVIASSFGDIFYNNCFQNGLLPVVLPEATVRHLAAQAEQGASLTIGLLDCAITLPGGEKVSFEINAARRQALIEGLDDISRTLRQRADIVAWQSRDRAARSWIWDLSDVDRQ